MGASTQDIVGRVREELATEGSYGEQPNGFRLPAATRLGPVRLQVTDLGQSIAFCQDVVGLRLIESDDGRASLGTNDEARVLVRLEERSAEAAVQRARLGLFHFAILLPDRAALGRFARHMEASGIPLNAGDHLVSEALYLRDPDGLGIEVYADRPRAEWRRVGRELVLATERLDIAALLAAAGEEPWTGMPAGTVVGHVHLRVGDLRQAAAFFSDALGFDLMTWSYPGALFLGAGGYHHHLGTNVWARGAQRADADEPQLLEWTIEVPDAISVEQAGRSLAEAGYPVTQEEGEITTRDPWGTAIRIREGQVGQITDGADVVIVATPYGAAADALRDAGDIKGRTVIDITNPLTDDMSGLTVGFSSSAAEEIQKAAPGAHVVKAFNTVFAQVLGGAAAAQSVQVFYAGDDDDAKQTARTIIESAGFEAVDAGPLTNARYLEPRGMFNIYLGYVAGRGTSAAPRWDSVGAG